MAGLMAVPAGCGNSDANGAPGAAPPEGAVVQLPNRDGSFKFGVLGDFGTGDRDQYEMGAQMAALQERFTYETIVLTGDNIYGSERPQDFRRKFEQPYKALLDRGVKFYASLGNHDQREQRYYKLFNMGGQLYYTFRPAADVRFFALETSYPEPEQIAWLERELKNSDSKWKIAFFHHPLYSSGGRHGSDLRLRAVLEPLFLQHNVSVVLQGHDHFYERTKPQKDITYFVIGAGGKLRDGNIDRRSGITAKGFDTDLTFMAAEIVDDQMYFNVISRTGQLIDSGIVTRRISPQEKPAAEASRQ
ncbi:MAG TPA: metallophosphoesterase [Vicinamibacterales bacterium]